jgi:hypothetical protein
VVHVVSSRRSRGSEAKDGRFDGVGCDIVKVGPNYPSLDVIFLLSHVIPDFYVKTKYSLYA